MKRRLLGIVGALLMAGFGTVLVVLFIQDAEARAVAGEELVDVIVVTEPIAPGTPAELVAASVRVEAVPVKVRADQAIVDLVSLDGLVTAVELLPGEQILRSRFVEPDLLSRARIDVPPGTVEVTLSLTPQRAVGGALFPGDEVVFFASFEPFELGGAPVSQTPEGDPLVEIDGILVPADTKTPNATHLVLERVLVTNVQVEELAIVEEDTELAERRALAPSGNLLISLAVPPAEAERIVFTAEHGTAWLGRQTGDLELDDTEVWTRGSIYDDGGES